MHATKRGLSKEEVCSLATRNRSGHTLDFVTGRGSISKAQLEPYLIFTPDHDALLISDGHWAYKAFANLKELRQSQ